MKVVEKSYSQIQEDSKLIKLATVTMLPYSFLFLFYVLYQAYFVLRMFGNETINIGSIKEYMDLFSEIMGPSMIFYFALIVIVVLFFYYIVPPIAEAAIIIYLNKKKPLSRCIMLWVTKFFPMFALHGLLSLFSYIFFLIIIARIWAVGMLNNIFITTLMCIWFALVVTISFLTVYSKYYIVLENKSVRESISESTSASIVNFTVTFKYVVLSYFLYLRFFINILFLIWVPALFLYIVLKTDLFDYNISRYLIFVILIVLWIVTAYVEGIIAAFFITQWNNVFRKIKEDEKMDTEDEQNVSNREA